jgi:hypothetical protein
MTFAARLRQKNDLQTVPNLKKCAGTICVEHFPHEKIERWDKFTTKLCYLE